MKRRRTAFATPEIVTETKKSVCYGCNKPGSRASKIAGKFPCCGCSTYYRELAKVKAGSKNER